MLQAIRIPTCRLSFLVGLILSNAATQNVRSLSSHPPHPQQVEGGHATSRLFLLLHPRSSRFINIWQFPTLLLGSARLSHPYRPSQVRRRRRSPAAPTLFSRCCSLFLRETSLVCKSCVDPHLLQCLILLIAIPSFR